MVVSKTKRKKREPLVVVAAPTEPTVLCDRCTRMAKAGTLPCVWVTCAHCLAGGSLGASR